MTSTKTQLQAEREKMAQRSDEVGGEIASGFNETGDATVDSVIARLKAEAQRHKDLIDQVVHTIDVRIILEDVLEKTTPSVVGPAESSLQDQAPVV